ncbi:MAG: hypothetical protein P4M07_27585 [Xanthobacteraceae bacterium]|nr:hypothetical protein [Xanthobacteraceae bacterium]
MTTKEDALPGAPLGGRRVLPAAISLSHPNQLLIWLGAMSAAAVLTVLWLLLDATGGVLAYSIDDSYIAMALSERIAQGTYGINLGEPANVSSSAIYPFLLLLGVNTPWHVATPLLVNVVGAAISLWAISRTVAFSRLTANGLQTFILSGLIFVFLLCLNFIGVIFIGLEHSLQIAAALVILAGIVGTLQGNSVPAWLVAAIAIAPLIRFEGIAGSLLAVAALLVLGFRRQAAAGALLGASGVGIFAAAMKMMDLPVVPVSITLKSPIATAAQFGNSSSIIAAVTTRMAELSAVPVAPVLLVLIALAVIGGCIGVIRNRNWREAIVPLYAAGVMGAHLVAGGFRWFERYDVYALLTGVVGLLYIYRDFWRWALSALSSPFLSREHDGYAFPRFLASFAIVGTAVLSVINFNADHWLATKVTPAAAKNILDQQGQMSRFVTDFYKAPVAVNDLGYVAWRNPYYVLDLVGLGSDEVVKIKLARSFDEAAISDLIDRHGIGLAMIYHWVTKGKGWEQVASLHLSTPRVSPADSVVYFYRTPNGSAQKIADALSRFKAALPDGVRLDMP